MEKEQPDSMTTVAIKPEYAPSEYSASEPPPAYRKPMSSAVQIARIAAFTIVASSLILGAFILASSYVQARAGCQQLEQLDAMLDKELALEGRTYGNDALIADEPLQASNAHALHGAPVAAAQTAEKPDKTGLKPVPVGDALAHAESKLNEDKLQKLDDDKEDAPTENSSDDSDSSDSDEDDDVLEAGLRLPIQFDLDDLAGAFLANSNQKGRMNCVVERRREEVIEKRFPFNLLAALSKPEPTERVAIICHGGDETNKPEFPEPAAQVFAFPLSGPPRLPVRPLPPAGLQPPAPAHRAAPFPMPMSWDSSEDQFPPREMRIHVQRIIAIPSRNMPGSPEPNMIPFSRQDDMFPRDMRPQDLIPRPEMLPRPQEIPFPRPEEMPFQQRSQDMPFPRGQELPFPRPQEIPFPRPYTMTLPAPQEMPYPRPEARAQEGQTRPQETVVPFPESMIRFIKTDPMPQEEQNEPSTMMRQFVPQPQQPIQEMNPEKVEVDTVDGPMLPWGISPETLRAIHRHAEQNDRQSDSQIDAQQQQMDSDMQEMKTIVNTLAAAAAAELEASAQNQSAETVSQEPARAQPVHLDAPVLIQHEDASEERPHYVQPRSVRSVDALLHREKRVKRCSCDCA